MGYFKKRDDDYQRGGLEPQVGYDRARQDNFGEEDDFIWQRERLCVMSAILNPIDDRNYKTTIAVVNKDGELKLTKDFFHMLPPRQFKRSPEEANQKMAPGSIVNLQEEEHEKNCAHMREVLLDHQVDLIVVAADCLEARKLKKVLSELYRSRKDGNDDPVVDDGQDAQGDQNQRQV